jgi:hypothetical protein
MIDSMALGASYGVEKEPLINRKMQEFQQGCVALGKSNGIGQELGKSH